MGKVDFTCGCRVSKEREKLEYNEYIRIGPLSDEDVELALMKIVHKL